MATYNKSLGKFQLDRHPAGAARHPADRGRASTSTPTASSTCRRRTSAPARSRRSRSRPAPGSRDDEIKQHGHRRRDARRRGPQAPRELAEARNNGENAAYQAERQLKDLGEQVDEASKTEIEAAIKDVREVARRPRTPTDINAKTEALQTAFHKVSEAMYERAQAAAGRRQPTRRTARRADGAARRRGGGRRRRGRGRGQVSDETDRARRRPRRTPAAEEAAADARRRRGGRRASPDERRGRRRPRGSLASEGRGRATTSTWRSRSARRPTSRTTASARARDVAAAETRGVAKLARELLPALDNLERALAAAEASRGPRAPPDRGHPPGAARAARPRWRAWASRPYSPEGEPFDPHRARGDGPAARRGRRARHGRRGLPARLPPTTDEVLRPAKVVVAA